MMTMTINTTKIELKRQINTFQNVVLYLIRILCGSRKP
jgi:hypothetical protein